MFVVLVLSSSYTASLTSMLTVQQLQPTITDIHDLIEEGDYIGYQYGSFVTGLLRNMNFDTSKFRSYRTLKEYDVALSKGSRNGGVAAIVDELPYIRMFLSKYCRKYTMIGPIYQTSGFGFAFPKGSPLVADVSRAILRLKEDEEMERISRKWFKEGRCRGSDGATVNTKSLSADSFKGLFLVAGLSSSLALAIFVSKFVYENRCMLNSAASTKLKIHDLARAFYQKKDGSTISEESLSP
ncbi:glutamate receptor 2.8-like [Salvia hispanica]|uniref:glutamate receptor 2.8-like n=1 Tax=Salvia hispanica TaxID=49212 RepID=UPI0020097BD7|nr:glutamate receptor 2.8-like [Salvia hispanica]